MLTFTPRPYQAQQDLAILACAQAGVADGMSATGLVPPTSTSAGHMQPVASSAMMWSAQVQAQALQQQQMQVGSSWNLWLCRAEGVKWCAFWDLGC